MLFHRFCRGFRGLLNTESILFFMMRKCVKSLAHPRKRTPLLPVLHQCSCGFIRHCRRVRTSEKSPRKAFPGGGGSLLKRGDFLLWTLFLRFPVPRTNRFFPMHRELPSVAGLRKLCEIFEKSHWKFPLSSAARKWPRGISEKSGFLTTTKRW